MLEYEIIANLYCDNINNLSKIEIKEMLMKVNQNNFSDFVKWLKNQLNEEKEQELNQILVDDFNENPIYLY